MTAWTPTKGHVRDLFVHARVQQAGRGAAFDRMLESERRAAKVEALQKAAKVTSKRDLARLIAGWDQGDPETKVIPHWATNLSNEITSSTWLRAIRAEAVREYVAADQQAQGES